MHNMLVRDVFLAVFQGFRNYSESCMIPIRKISSEMVEILISLVRNQSEVTHTSVWFR